MYVLNTKEFHNNALFITDQPCNCNISYDCINFFIDLIFSIYYKIFWAISTNYYGILIQFINLSSYPILKCASVSSLLLLFNVKRFHGVIYMRSFPFVCVCINTKLVQILKMLIRQESVFRVCKMNQFSGSWSQCKPYN